ncbi:MAG: pyridoxal phosphate-dependent aminotransferase, partial [Acidobacteriota bacterium]|nr:pyridoxal phosphate-dependent aminotransferase [Acidobacteriota bacterium]
KLECVRAVPYKLLYDGSWFIDIEDLRQRISPATRAIVVVNPNNPTGSYLKPSEAQHLISVANENQLPIIVDEVFADYSLSKSSNRVETFAEFDSIVSFSMNGLSKIAGMPQMKLGWILLNGPAAQVEPVRHRLELILDTYLSVNTPVQQALPALFEIGEGIQTQLKHRAILNWEAARRVLEHSPAHCLHTEGGWSAIIQLPRNLSEDAWITKLLDDEGIVVQPGYFFDMTAEAYIVVSLITPPEQFFEGLQRLRQLVTSEDVRGWYSSQLR